MTDIPQWAAQKACDLANAEHGHDFWTRDNNSPTIRALARLIAKTMPEPVDPVKEVLKAVYGGCAPEFLSAFYSEMRKRNLAIIDTTGATAQSEVAPVREVGHE